MRRPRPARRGGFKEHSYCAPRPTSAADWQRFSDTIDAEDLVFQAKRAGPTSAVARVAPTATAFPWRTAQWCAQLVVRWQKAEDRAAALARLQRARRVAEAIFTDHAYSEQAGRGRGRCCAAGRALDSAAPTLHS